MMNLKKAGTAYPVIDLIRDRWSPRSFGAAPISETDLRTILEAASWSFSAGNMQPWFFLYAHRGTPGFDKILDGLAPGNQIWARHAAVLMVCLAKKERDPGKPNHWARHDLGAANLQLILQATSMNISGHVMAGFEATKIIENLDFDSSVYEPVTCMALGYAGDPGQLDDPLREKELAVRTRRGIEEISREVV